MNAKPPKKQVQDMVQQALSSRDAQGVLAALDKGLSPAWHDEAGRTVLHYAAAWGDEALAQAALDKGVSALQRDKDAQSPADMAALYGYDGLSKKFAAAAVAARAQTPPAALSYASLTQLREASARSVAEGKADIFYSVAREGRFEEIVALAEKDGTGLTAKDLLGRGADGRITAEILATTGQFAGVMKPALWLKSGQDFQKVWNSLSVAHRQGLDVQAFTTELSHARLASYVKPQLRANDKGQPGQKKQ